VTLANHLFGEVHTALAPETLLRGFRDAGWSVHRCARDEYRLEAEIGELVLVTRTPYLLHGPISNVVNNVDSILGVFDTRVGYWCECFGSDATLWRLASARVPLPLDLLTRLALRPSEPLPHHELGLALDSLSRPPLNGLRHRPENGTSGWYVWGGESVSPDSAFFRPLHHAHVADHCPEALPFLSLPPGWRFLSSQDQCDVWRDDALTNPP
jgi:hypothetical protein